MTTTIQNFQLQFILDFNDENFTIEKDNGSIVYDLNSIAQNLSLNGVETEKKTIKRKDDYIKCFERIEDPDDSEKLKKIRGIVSVKNNISINGLKSISFYVSNPLQKFENPPANPILENYYCINCKSIGPLYHEQTCIKPDNSSLKNCSTYKDYIRVTRGREKVIKQRDTHGSFPNTLVMKFLVDLGNKDNETKELEARLSNEGKLVFLGVPYMNSKKETEDLIYSIHEMVLNKFSELTEEDIRLSDPQIIYMRGQFNLLPLDKSKGAAVTANNKINLNQFSQVSEKKFKLKSEQFKFTEDYTVKWNSDKKPGFEYNTGKITKQNTNTASLLILRFRNISDSVNITVQIYNGGAVQMIATPANTNNDNNDNDSDFQENLLTTQKFNTFVKNFREWIDKNINLSLFIIEGEKTKKKYNTVTTGKNNRMVAPKCRPENRPDPYSFYGKCPTNQYIFPAGKPYNYDINGVKTKLYEPCCQVMKKGTEEQLKKYYLYGFPGSEAERIKYQIGETDSTDKAKTLTMESRRFGLTHRSKTGLLKCIENVLFERNIEQQKELETIEDEINYDLFSTWAKKMKIEPMYFQYSTPFRLGNIEDNFTKELYVAMPLYKNAERKLCWFNENGKGFLVNPLKRTIVSLENGCGLCKNTLIECYTLDYKSKTYIILYDLIVFGGNDQSKKQFLTHESDSRYNFLRDLRVLLDTINDNSKYEFRIICLYIDILSGVREILDKNEVPVNGILFKNIKNKYTSNKIDSNSFIWTTEYDSFPLFLQIKDLSDKKLFYNKTEEYKIFDKTSFIISKKWLSQNNVQDMDTIYFKLDLNKDGEIKKRIPLTPIENLGQAKEFEVTSEYFTNVYLQIVSKLSKRDLLNSIQADDGIIMVGDKAYSQRDGMGMFEEI